MILRYQVAGDDTQTTVLTQSDERGGHFAVYLIPAIEYKPNQIVPKDVVFLIDTSGSQSGAPLQQCQELMRRFINGLNPNDTFSIIDFSNTTQHLSPVPLVNTAQNRSLAINYINQLNANGGTELLKGIRAVLNFPVTDPGRLRSIVLLTDGYIGNENQIFAEVLQNLKPGNRLHSFGAGSSVNRFLLNRISEIGGGISRIIRHDKPINEVVENFFHQINNPVLGNINWQWEGEGDSPIIYPQIPPDLFAQQPLVLFGRKSDKLAGKLHINGIVAGGMGYQQTFTLNFDDVGNPAIAQLWGRSRIKNLMNLMVRGDTKKGVEAVTDTALTYQLLSQYTAFVAVSDDVRVDTTESSISVQVPVEMPEAVSYKGVFGNVPSSYSANQISLSERQGYNSVVGDLQGRGRGGQAPQSVHYAIEETRKLREFKARELAANSPGKVPVVRLKIEKATGLDENVVALLTNHLQLIKLPEGCSGELVFELQVKKGRVRQVVWDEEASSVKEQSTIDLIRLTLLTWLPPRTITNTIHLHIRIEA